MKIKLFKAKMIFVIIQKCFDIESYKVLIIFNILKMGRIARNNFNLMAVSVFENNVNACYLINQ